MKNMKKAWIFEKRIPKEELMKMGKKLPLWEKTPQFPHENDELWEKFSGNSFASRSAAEIPPEEEEAEEPFFRTSNF